MAPDARAEEHAPLTPARDAWTLPLLINGVGPYPFVVDTMIERPIIDAQVAAFLQLPTIARGDVEDATGDATATTAVGLDALSLGREHLGFGRGVVMDLSELTSRLGQPAAGILPGWLPGLALTIDVRGGTAAVADTLDADAGDAAVALVEARATEHGLAVQGVLNDSRAALFVIDTTFAPTLGMPESLIRDLGLWSEGSPYLKVQAPEDETRLPAGTTQVRLGSFTLGGISFGAPVCAVLDAGEPARVGLGFLRHFRVTLATSDSGGRVRLERGSREAIGDGPITGYGLALGRYEGGYWSVYVAAESPASRAGMASGCRLESINRHDLANQPYDTVARFLDARPGEEASIQVRADGHIETFLLKAETLL
ncbi:MAG TPA: hypothetical protein PLO37_13280 [Candidatus Hydrogenedentes bacterium]|nr:hypothetical protein [Candidatus Hydrogenedentota bacterium]HPG67815.1 hypothetical protein [Candidatus Hydrogenedentota bacterium]